MPASTRTRRGKAAAAPKTAPKPDDGLEIDLDTILIGPGGEQILEPVPIGNGVYRPTPVPLGAYLYGPILRQRQSDAALPMTESLRIVRLSQKVLTGGRVLFSRAEVDLIVKRLEGAAPVGVFAVLTLIAPEKLEG